MIRTVRSFPEDQPEAYLGNGMIGYRVKAIPFASWKAVASGYVESQEQGRFETLAYAPYPFQMDFRLDRSPSAMERADDIRVLSQTLDMSCGELHTALEIPIGDRYAPVEILQFVSRTCPVLFCQEIRLTLPVRGELEITNTIAPGRRSALYCGMLPGHDHLVDLMCGYAAAAERSRCGVSVKVDVAGATREPLEEKEQAMSRKFRLNVSPGGQVIIRSVAATVTSLYHPEPELESCRVLNWGLTIGFDRLGEANRGAWEEIWKSRVMVTGDDVSQEYLDCALFYLFSSAHASCRTSIPPFGMSQATNYHGHIFWDTDIYMTPTLLLVSPETAQMTIDYRYRCLQAARKRAACYGFRGAMYPWESDSKGFESTPSACPTGWMEQHVNMCVAVAAWWYYLATRDIDYASDCIWPILKAVAEWIESRVVATSRGYELRHIMSADEGLWVNNSSYSNGLCAAALRAACQCASLIGRTPGRKWNEIAERMFIPIGPPPQASGIDGEVIMVHEGGWDENASVDSFSIGFPFDLPFDRDLLRRTYDSAMKLKQETVCMGHCFFAGEAAFVGDRQGARDLFHRVIDETQEPVWGMGTEHTHDRTTCFVTTMGGMLQSAMMAFTGIRFEPDNWTRYEACLPEGWDSIEIDRIWLGGRPWRLRAKNGARAELIAA